MTIDLPQVDLMNFRIEFVGPVFEGVSDEVARGRLVSLEGFSFSFGSKNEEWRDLQLVSQITFEWRQLSVPLRPKQSNMHAFQNRQKSKFVYSVLKWLQTKILEENL